ncbi:MAG: hypothetical protein QOH72_893 [Solirubrobacteraceae bacterium]|nr:hypothetical protein [Solirubrobacteraceae bacterium]
MHTPTHGASASTRPQPPHDYTANRSAAPSASSGRRGGGHVAQHIASLRLHPPVRGLPIVDHALSREAIDHGAQRVGAPSLGAKPCHRPVDGGIAARIVLILFGAGALVMGVSGRSEVRDNLKREQIVGTPDMAKSVANKQVTTGAQAKALANGMRKHTLEATGRSDLLADGPVPRQGRQADQQPAGRRHRREDQKPVSNPAGQIWVTETALTTALNTSFFAESVCMFAIVMGVALLLVGGGFLVLTLRVLRQPSSATRRQPQAAVAVAAS